jgi:guanosine-3',5'-bis(diphosphate) 3'-pyrophosphohydrolase
MTDDFRILQNAISLASRAHRWQIRKDKETPYVAHPFRVCMTLRHLFGIDDVRILTAAVLHDTIEDTTTDADDLIEGFGEEIASWVALLSKDKRLPEAKRESAYRKQIETAPWPVKLIKLADLFDNVSDTSTLPPDKREKTFSKARTMLPHVLKGLPSKYKPAAQKLVDKLDSTPRRP